MLDANNSKFNLKDFPKIMGILNVTPDSFSDGGNFLNLDESLRHAEHMVIEGADIIDIGGESSRPGSEPVSTQEEIDRIIPVIEAIADRLDIPISVDTSKPDVMSNAINAGACMINDINALRAEGAIDVAAETQAFVCLMHMRGKPKIMQESPHYKNVVQEVKNFLLTRADLCEKSGILKNKIVIDPGFGFGKNLNHNLSLLKELPQFAFGDYPILVGISRKSMLGEITRRSVDRRLAGSLFSALIALQKGASILRVHDVAETKDIVRLWQALEST